MKPGSGLVQLTSVVGSFHAQVLKARLESEGIRCELDPPREGPYPFPMEVSVFVPEDQLNLAREVLLADAVDAAYSEPPRKAVKASEKRWSLLRRREAR